MPFRCGCFRFLAQTYILCLPPIAHHYIRLAQKFFRKLTKKHLTVIDKCGIVGDTS